MARVTSEVYLWEKWPCTIDTENGTVRLESRGRVDEWWSGLEITRHGQTEWRTTHPEFGAMTINAERGCACSGLAIKTDTRGRPVAP
jgi:hypothetical protein